MHGQRAIDISRLHGSSPKFKAFIGVLLYLAATLQLPIQGLNILKKGVKKLKLAFTR